MIELVLVIVISTIFAAVIFFDLNLGSNQVNSAVNKVVADLRYAQQLAITTQTRHGMTITSTAAYTVHWDVPPDTAVSDPVQMASSLAVNFDTFRQGQLNGVRFSSATPFQTAACPGSGAAVIEFNSAGAPTDTSGTVLTCDSTLTLTRSGVTSTITIRKNTGYVVY